jgi:putative transposase
MPRRPRLALSGIPWHIIQRGVNRSTCFFAEDDYLFYLHYLGEYSRNFGCDIHAYVLMTNHVHLLLTPKEPESAGRMMKHLGQRYVQYINRINGRSGTLWEGRFASCLAQTEDYVLACYRYIELNPVRAGMVTHPRQYRWSSYATNGEGKASDLIKPHDQYLRIGRTESERLEHYRALFKAHMDSETIENIREATNGNYALGHPRFQAEIQTALGRRAMRGKAGRPKRVPQEDGRQMELLDAGR